MNSIWLLTIVTYTCMIEGEISSISFPMHYHSLVSTLSPHWHLQICIYCLEFLHITEDQLFSLTCLTRKVQCKRGSWKQTWHLARILCKLWKAVAAIDYLFSTYQIFKTIWKHLCSQLNDLRQWLTFHYLNADWIEQNFSKKPGHIILILLVSVA